MVSQREIALCQLQWLRTQPLHWMPAWMWKRVRRSILEAILCALDVYSYQRSIPKPSNN